MKSFIRHTHPSGFRWLQWAEIKCIVPGSDRDCYLVEFPDGVTDFWVVSNDQRYEFREESDEATSTP